ncbi:choice-of-anchor D domain-containing protein [candidate division KSB1 bacterium]
MNRNQIRLFIFILTFSSAVFAQTDEIYLSSYSLNYGSVELGDDKIINLTIFNNSSNSLTVNSITLNNASFQVSEDNFSILPSGQKSILITFSPSILGAISGILSFDWSANSTIENDVVLSGTGIPRKDPVISSSKDSLLFGHVEIDDFYDLSFTIYNTGDDTLFIENFSFDITAYLIIGNNREIPPGDSSDFIVKFSPKSIAVKEGFLKIHSNDFTQNPKEIYLLGRGTKRISPLISLNKSQIDFGVIYVGDEYQESIIISNTGDADLIINNIESSNINVSVTLSDSIIEKSTNSNLSILISSITAVDIKDEIKIYSSDKNRPVLTVPVTGEIKEIPKAKIRVSNDTLDFRYVFLDSTESKTLSIFNDGETTLTVTSILLLDNDFTIDKSSFTLQPDVSIDIVVSFNPDEVKHYTSTLLIQSNDPDVPIYSVYLIGQSKDLPSANILVYPVSINFQNVETRDLKIEKLYISNDGELDLIINNPEFSHSVFYSDISGLTIAPGMMDSMNIYFMPQIEGQVNGWLRIKSNALDSVLLVDLTGTGFFVPRPILEVTPDTIDFGDVFTEDDVEFAFGLTNIGEQSINISNVYSNSEIIQLTLGSTIIAPGSSISLDINLNNDQAGEFTDTIFIQSNNKDGTIKIPVHANFSIRNQSIIEISNINIDFGNVYVTESKTVEIMIYNTGNKELEINSIISDESHFSGMVVNSNIGISDSTKLFLVFSPEEEKEYTGELTIQNNSFVSPYFKVTLTGMGIIPDEIDTINVFIKSSESSSPENIDDFVEGDLFSFSDLTGKFAFLNGTALRFPVGSLKKSFGLEISIPFPDQIASIEMKDREIISIVKLSSMRDTSQFVIKKPLYFEIPIDVSALEKLNINKDSLTISIYDGNFNFDEQGIDDIYFDKVNNLITGNLKYLSILAVTSVKRVKEGYADKNIFDLKQNFPNPFNAETVIRYKVNSESDIRIEIFNSLGQHIKTLINKYHRPGFYVLRWDGKNDKGNKISSGTYYYRIISGDNLATKAMVFIK